MFFYLHFLTEIGMKVAVWKGQVSVGGMEGLESIYIGGDNKVCDCHQFWRLLRFAVIATT